MICLFFLASQKQYFDFGIDPSCITAEQHYITYSHTEQNTSEGHYEMSPKDVSFVRNQGCLDVSGQNDSFRSIGARVAVGAGTRGAAAYRASDQQGRGNKYKIQNTN